VTVKTTKMQTRTKVLVGLAALVIGVGVTAGSCDKQTEPFKDAPRSYNDTSLPMDVVQGADGFTNAGTTCDSRGNRVYVAYHGDNLYASVAVVPYALLKPDDPCRALSGGGRKNAGGE
jgi:hypothetical protein